MPATVSVPVTSAAPARMWGTSRGMGSTGVVPWPTVGTTLVSAVGTTLGSAVGSITLAETEKGPEVATDGAVGLGGVGKHLNLGRGCDEVEGCDKASFCGSGRTGWEKFSDES